MHFCTSAILNRSLCVCCVWGGERVLDEVAYVCLFRDAIYIFIQPNVPNICAAIYGQLARTNASPPFPIYSVCNLEK